MANSKHIAGLIGPSIVAITISEMVNIHIWAGNTAAGVYLNGAILFVAGLAIVRAHNLWVRSWPVLITLTGWLIMLLENQWGQTPLIVLKLKRTNGGSHGF